MLRSIRIDYCQLTFLQILLYIVIFHFCFFLFDSVISFLFSSLLCSLLEVFFDALEYYHIQSIVPMLIVQNKLCVSSIECSKSSCEKYQKVTADFKRLHEISDDSEKFSKLNKTSATRKKAAYSIEIKSISIFLFLSRYVYN